MSYPRLVFADQIPPRVISEEVISDLKLELVLPVAVTDFLLLRPERETLLLRRQTFKALLADDSARETLALLSQTLAKAKELYSALISAQSEKTAALIFPSLLIEIDSFCRAAEKASGYGLLFERFSAAMTEIRSAPAFETAAAEAQRLVEITAPARKISITTDTETARVQKPLDFGIAAALRACANELGIELSAKKTEPFALQKGFADAFGTVYSDRCGMAVDFLKKHRALVTGEIFEYLPELDFLIGILDFTKRASEKGLPVSFPELAEEKCIDMHSVYDITLLKKEGTVIVPNDVRFTESEPFFYLTGANGGGKTTYIRTVGGAVLLFLAGAPVFCDGGRASLLSGVYTHFPRDERFEGTGRFLDEKNRVDGILSSLDGNSLVLLNETFATTGEEKAIEQTGILADTLSTSGNFGLYITHQHGLSKTEIPFLGVMIDERESNRRTYKIEKKRLPPKSFARDILEKYGLDSGSLSKRFS